MSTINKQITVKGTFNRTVIVNDSFVNGENCQYDDTQALYSHAEGFQSKASGKYSHAEGINARANHDRSYVFSGTDPANIGTAIQPTVSKGIGTYCIYTASYNSSSASTSANGIEEVYINGSKSSDILNHYRALAVNDIRTNENTFTKSLYMSGDRGVVQNVEFSQDVHLLTHGTSEFQGSVTLSGESTALTQTTDVNDDKIATCAFVHSVVQSYLRNILGDGVFKSETD